MGRKLVIITLLGLLPLSSLDGQSFEADRGSGRADGGSVVFSAGLMLGYTGGPGAHAFGMVSDFADGWPVGVRLGIGRTFTDPGDPAGARRVFINNATNGTPEERGRSWEYGLDVLVPVDVLSLDRAFLVAGIRHSRFTANFRFVGGNEDFDVKSNHWGFGAGLDSFFAMGRRVDLLVSGTLEYFAPSRLTGHDTSYSPDGTAVNPREDYTYDDANRVVSQPGFRPRLLLGFSYRL